MNASLKALKKQQKRPQKPDAMTKDRALYLKLTGCEMKTRYQSRQTAQSGHLWSISVEELFYLVWPTVVLISRSRLVIVSACIFPLAMAVALANDNDWFNPMAQFAYFAAGAMMATWTHSRDWKPTRVRRIMMLIGGLMLWLPVPNHRLGRIDQRTFDGDDLLGRLPVLAKQREKEAERRPQIAEDIHRFLSDYYE